MNRFAARTLAWIALGGVALVAAGARIAPCMEAGLAGAASLCAPDETSRDASSDSAGRASATLHVPRCGVA